MKRSMNANIFLKQFKASHEEVVRMIQVVKMISLDDMHSENIWFA